MKKDNVIDAEFEEIVESEQMVRIKRIWTELKLLMRPFLRGTPISDRLQHAIFKRFVK